MQELARQPELARTAAVLRIAGDRVADGLQVDADLVGAARFQPAGQLGRRGRLVEPGCHGVTGAGFSIMQTLGGGDASVRIAAYNDTDDSAGSGLKTLNGSIVAIDINSIVVTGDTTYTIINMGDGTFVITGLSAGAHVSFSNRFF